MANTKENRMRTVIFRPYVKGMGLPEFRLELFDPGNSLSSMQVGYRLRMMNTRVHKPIVLFESPGDFRCSPMHAIDSDECVRQLMGFLCLRPGDVYKEYFQDYTDVQMEFATEHAESLELEVCGRFGFE